MRDDDLRFLERRARLVRSWRPVGVVSLVVLAGILSWLMVRSPALVNPVYVVTQLEKGALEKGTIELMAAILPLAVLGCFVTTTVMMGYGFAVFALERRYLCIIEGLKSGVSAGTKQIDATQ